MASFGNSVPCHSPGRRVRYGTDDGEGGSGESVLAGERGVGAMGGELPFGCGAFGLRHRVTFRFEL